MITEEKLKKYSNDLEFDMDNDEYKTLMGEFDILLKQVELIENIEGISSYEPMDFPFALESASLREDKVSMSLNQEDALKNSKDVCNGCVKTPRVVA